LAGAGIFLLLFQTGCGAHVASQPTDTGGSFTRDKIAGHEAVHSPVSWAEIQMPAFPYMFYGMVLI
jgi:hypothetical protein